MSDNIIMVKGKVQRSITLDPPLWIFDDRKKKIEDFFYKKEKEVITSPEEQYKRMVELWNQELHSPRNEKAFLLEKTKIEGDYGIKLWPFLKNAKPLDDVQQVKCETKNGEELILSLEEAKDVILCFAINGKPIQENGPVYLYYGDGKNKEHPFKGITSFILL